MTGNPNLALAEQPVEEAINRVLELEQSARAAVERCQSEARVHVEQGRAQSRRILERADEAIARVRARSDSRIETRLAEIEADTARVADEPLLDAAQSERLEHLLPVLAEELLESPV